MQEESYNLSQVGKKVGAITATEETKILCILKHRYFLVAYLLSC